MESTGDFDAVHTGWKASVAILGARMHYAVPLALASVGRLGRLYTDWYWPDSGLSGALRRMLSKFPLPAIRRAVLRVEARLPDEKVQAFLGLGLTYSLLLRLSKTESSRERIFEKFNAMFGRFVAHSGFPEVQAVYGMNAASLEIFREANRRGLACILEQCIAPYQVLNRLMAEEYALWPGWEAGEAWQPSDRLASREVQEWVLADAILAGSPFVIANLPQEAAVQEKILLVPYAVDTDAYRTVALTPQAASEDSLKVLFLGGVGLRKGIQYLHRAVELLGSAKITVSAVGAVSVNPAAARQLSRRMSLHGLVPRAEVMQWLSWADVVVLPSICEGSAVATYEALAAGLPVIATPNAGAPILDSQTGFIVPVRDPSAIAERLEQLASSPRLRQEMGQSARRYAEEHLSWEAYAERLLAACETALQRRQCAA